MSCSNLFMKSMYPKAPLRNGVGRYVCQLQRITLKFCKTHGGSKGIREFIETDLVDFARANPGIAVYLKPRRHRTPCLWAEYLNGGEEYIGCNNLSRSEVYKWLSWMRTKSGFQDYRYLSYTHTDNPSIQGVWSPFTHRDPADNIAEFPLNFVQREDINFNAERQAQSATKILFQKENIYAERQAPSATEILLQMYKRQQSEEEANTSRQSS